MFAGGVRFHTAVVFLIVVVDACHIYSWFLPMSWVLGLSILSICRVYIYFEVYVRLIMSSYLLFCTRYLLQCLVYHMLSKMKRGSGIYRVISNQITTTQAVMIRCTM